MNQRIFKTILLVLTYSLILSPITASTRDLMSGLSEKAGMVIDREAKEIRILAVLQPDAFSRRWLNWTTGHHAVVSKHGGRSDYALLAAYVPDSALHDALVSMGAEPGNNLTQETWEERKNLNNKEPDKRVEGTRVRATVWWEGLREPIELGELFVDPGDKGVDFRFGGHKHLIPIWNSGCIVCLQSCPGGKISNHAYTMRDYAQGRAAFKLNHSVVPEGTRQAIVIFRLVNDTD